MGGGGSQAPLPGQVEASRLHHVGRRYVSGVMKPHTTWPFCTPLELCNGCGEAARVARDAIGFVYTAHSPPEGDDIKLLGLDVHQHKTLPGAPLPQRAGAAPL